MPTGHTAVQTTPGAMTPVQMAEIQEHLMTFNCWGPSEYYLDQCLQEIRRLQQKESK